MNKKEIIEIAMRQLAKDYNCKTEDLTGDKNAFNANKLITGRRINDNDGCFVKILAINNIIAVHADDKILPWFEEKLSDIDGEWIFEYPYLKAIDKKLMEYDHEIIDTHHF